VSPLSIQEKTLNCSLTRVPSARHLLVWQKRKATAVTLIVIYSILLLLLASSYLRAVVTLAINPGFVPKGPPRNVSPDGSQQQLDGAEDGYSEAGSGGTLMTAAPAFASSTEMFSSPPLPGSPSATAESERLSVAPSDQVPQTPNSTTLLNPPPPLLDPPPPHHAAHSPHTANGMQGRAFTCNPRPQEGTSPSDLRCFLDKEIFVCEGDGLPRYCSRCNCWKPDRSHHCSEIGRCVWRMDHFCPWYSAHNPPPPPRRKRLLMKSKGWRMCSRNELSILLSGRGLRPAVLSLPNRQHRSSAAREEQSR